MLIGCAKLYIKLVKYIVLFISEDMSDTMVAQLSAILLHFDNEDYESPIEMCPIRMEMP